MNSRLIRAGACAALVLGLCAGRSIGRPFRFDELARAGRVGGFSVSPDGRWIACAVGTPDVVQNRTDSAIWLVPAAGGPPRRLTAGDKRDSDPAFAPDGRRIAFLSNRNGGSQIWLLDLAGGEPRQATSFPTEVNAFKWTRDGESFLVVSDVFPECADAGCLTALVAAREKAVIRARVAQRLLFRHWDFWQNGLRSHVWRVPVAGGVAVDLTPGEIDAPTFEAGGSEDFEISSDGKDVVYSSNPDRVQAISTNSDVGSSRQEAENQLI